MTDTVASSSHQPLALCGRPPYSRTLRRAAGASLIVAGLLNGGVQYAGHLAAGDLMFTDLIRWGAEHPVFHGVTQGLMMLSSLFMPIGLLGVAHLCRFRAPRLTAVATPLVLWGMWGFGNILASGYVAGTVAPRALSVEQAVQLNESFLSDPGLVAFALVPHLVGSLLGVFLLCVAAWRTRTFPRPAVVLLVLFLVWDFFLPPVGLLEAHLLLVAAWAWMGWHLMRTSDEVWSGAEPRGSH